MPFLTQGKTNLKYILIIVILTATVVGIWAYQYWWIPRQETNPPEIAIKNETAGWQTYRNEEYGFEFKYPSEFGNVRTEEFRQMPPIGDEGKIIQLSFSDEDKIGANIFIPDKYTQAVNTFDTNCNIKTIDKENSYLCDEISAAEQKRFYIVGLRFMPECGEALFSQELSIPLTNKKAYITLSQSFPEIDDALNKNYNCSDNQTALAVEELANNYLNKLYKKDPTEPATQLISKFNQILSTFKFIEPVDTSNWQTYRNESYRLLFQYPPDWSVELIENQSYPLTFQGDKQGIIIAQPNQGGEKARNYLRNIFMSYREITESFEKYIEPEFCDVGECNPIELDLQEEVLIDGRKGVLQVGDLGIVGKQIQCFIQAEDGRILTIYSTIGDNIESLDSKNQIQVFRAILNSIKFLD